MATAAEIKARRKFDEALGNVLEPGGKRNGAISLERFAYLQLFVERKKADPSLTMAQYRQSLVEAIDAVDAVAAKAGHKRKIGGKREKKDE